MTPTLLDTEAFDKAARFLSTEARPLEAARFETLFKYRGLRDVEDTLPGVALLIHSVRSHQTASPFDRVP